MCLREGRERHVACVSALVAGGFSFCALRAASLGAEASSLNPASSLSTKVDETPRHRRTCSSRPPLCLSVLPTWDCSQSGLADGQLVGYYTGLSMRVSMNTPGEGPAPSRLSQALPTVYLPASLPHLPFKGSSLPIGGVSHLEHPHSPRGYGRTQLMMSHMTQSSS